MLVSPFSIPRHGLVSMSGWTMVPVWPEPVQLSSNFAAEVTLVLIVCV
jgi:hypothetical protein